MVDIQSAAVEIRRGIKKKKERKKPQGRKSDDGDIRREIRRVFTRCNMLRKA